MKRLLLTLAVSLFCCVNLFAQTIMGYNFESTVGTYTEITDGVKMNTEGLSFSDGIAWIGSADAISELTNAPGFDIGFNFKFNDQEMNKFAIGADFTLFLGKDELTVDPGRLRWFLSDSDEDGNMTHNIIQSALTEYNNVSCGESTEISYKLIGEAPNRTLVVQFKDVVAMRTEYSCDLQIRLNETKNTIDIVYNDWNDDWNEEDKYTSIDVGVGIKGNDGDVLSLAFGDENGWENLVTEYEATTIEWSMEYSPVDGLTFTFTPGADCATPTVQATDLNVEVGSSVINGSFVAAEDVDRYLILLTEGEIAQTTDFPIDGKLYKRLDKIGNSVVLGFTVEENFTTLDRWGENPEIIINPETEYYVTVIAANSLCSNGPKYNFNEVLQKLVTTAPSAPSALDVVSTDTDMIEINFKGNASKHDIVVAYTDVPLRMDPHVTWLGTGVFGTPSGDLNVGDEIEGGGIVCYAGPAEDATSVKVENLKPNTVYHFSAWSRNDNNEYSTDTICVSNITNATTPFEFDLEAIYGGCELGVTMDGFSVTNDKEDEYAFYFNKATIGSNYTITTQWITLSAGINRLLFDFTMWTQGGMTWNPTITPFNEWNDADEFVIESSADEENWTPLLTINKDNAPTFAQSYEYSSQIATFDGDDTQVKIRIRYTSGTAGVYSYFKNFRIEEKKDCDYPINLVAKEVEGDKATVIWEQQGEETEWYVEWRIAGDEEWNTSVATSREFVLEGLPGRSLIEVRVAAKCSETESSDWSKVLKFTSGYVIPFTERFSDENFPAGWEFKTGELTETGTVFEDGGWYSMTNRFGGYYVMHESSPAPVNSWVLSPVLNLGDGDVNYVITYTLTSIMQGDSEDEKIKIVVSDDAGATFKMANVILEENAPNDSETIEYTVALEGYKGKCRIGLLFTSNTEESYSSYLQFESMSIDEACPTDVVVEIKDVEETSARATWTGTIDEGKEWMVFIRKEGETSKDYKMTSDAEMLFENLEIRTTYEVGVTKACDDNNVARPVIVKFTTLATEPCLPIEEVTATPDVYDVVLEWEGDAYFYNIRYREQSAQEWKEIKEVKENTYTIEDLKPETAYVYQVQVVCSPAENDFSDWSEEATFTTLVESCFAPTNLKVETTYNTAVVTWEGTSCSYEIVYCVKGDEEYDTLKVTELTYTLTDLEPATEYELRLRGLCPDQDQVESRWTEVVAFKTKELLACEAPTELEADVTAFAEDGTVTLTWEGNEEHLYYEVQYREGSSTTWITIDSLTEATVVLEDLEAEATYLWRVRANCTVDRVTDWSAQATFETPKTSEGSDVLAAPVITAEVSNDTIYVSWEAVEGAVGYNLYYQKQLLSSFTETEVAVTIVQAGEYCFTVTAYNAAKEESEHSNEACETVTAPEGLEVPEAPVLSAKIENDSVVLSWNSVETATYYVVYFGDKLLGNHNGTTLSLALPEPGTYCFTVAAANLAGESEPSNEACVTYGEGLEELSAAINIYPNPVQNELLLATEFEVESISVYDIYGRQQAISYQLSAVSSIDVAELNSGIYFVKVVTSNGEIVKRFIKN